MLRHWPAAKRRLKHQIALKCHCEWDFDFRESQIPESAEAALRLSIDSRPIDHILDARCPAAAAAARLCQIG